MKKHIFILCLLLFVAIRHTLQAQTGKFYSADKELSNSLINNIFQDSKGFVWIATEDGLNKFDGNKFTIYRHNNKDKSSILDNYVKMLYEDSSNRLWVACGGGIQVYNRATDSFDNVDIRLNRTKIWPAVTSIIKRKNGDIWISTSGQGIFSMHKGSQKRIFNAEEKFSKKTNCYLINILFEDSKTNLWIATEDRGVFCYQTKTGIIQNYCSPLSLTGEDISAICEDNSGNLFVGTLTEGLNMLKAGAKSFIPVRYKNNTRLKVKSLLLDRQNKLYVGIDGDGLKEFDRSTNTLKDSKINTTSFDFSKSKIHSILEDKDRNLWLGIFEKGIILVPGSSKKFDYYGYKSVRKNSIGSSCVLSVCIDHEGITWVGTDNDGLYAIDKGGELLKHFSPKNGHSSMPETVMCICEDSNHELWVGSYFNGLAKVNKSTGKCEYVKGLNKERNTNKSEKVYSLMEDNSNNLWIGTYGKGLYKMNLKSKQITLYEFNKEGKKNTSNNVFPLNRINSIIQDHSGLIWTGASGGLTCYSPNKESFVNFLGKNNLLPGYLVFTLLEDKQNQIWVGTTVGLLCFDKRKQSFRKYTISNGLPSNVICGLAQDNSGNIWISTHQGISKFIVNKNKFVNFYASDGLQGNEFTRGAVFKCKDGRIFFGGTSGVTAFYPQEITESKRILSVIISDFLLFNRSIKVGDKSGGRLITKKPITDTKKITLAHNESTFSIEFSALEFNNPERIYYQYMIEELKNEWINTPYGINKVTYSNLRPGKYTFKVRACDYNNISAVKTITIIITPPWYQTWWATCLWIIIICIIIYYITTYLISQIHHRQEMIEREHKEQLNEAKLQFFINISHEIRTPMTLIISPLEKLLAEKNEKHPVYLMMYRNAQRILRLINQLMDVRKIEKGLMEMHFRETDIIGFIKDIMQVFDYSAKNKNISFNFTSPKDMLKVWVDLNNFDKVLLNIVSNAFKYTPDGGTISINLTTGHDNSVDYPLSDFFEISITDNGIGIDKDKVEQIFERFYQINNSLTESSFGTGIGLHLSRSIVKLHHGTIKAENRADEQGSRFIIRLPLGHNHLSEIEIETSNELNENLTSLARHSSMDQTLAGAQKTSKAKKSRTKYHVLIVEDEDEIRQYIKEELSNEFRISECSNGKQALEFILTEKPDLVISDVMMPEMDGITLCRKIKNNINIYSIPIVLLTAKNSTEDQLEGLDIGADAYIGKPFNIDFLISTVSNLIGNRERIKNKLAGEKQVKENIVKINMKSNDEILMEKTLKIINEYISDPTLNVEMLAENIGMSRAHLHRKLKELTGQSAGDFIRSVKLKQAAALLAEKSFTISEVAYRTGFINMSHFSTAFKLFYGVSPKEYATTHFVQQNPKHLLHDNLNDK